jgi:hypothetical protein
MVEIPEDTDLQLTPMEDRPQVLSGFHQCLPADARNVKGNFRRDGVVSRMLVALDRVQCLNQGLVLGRRAEG